MEFQLINRQFDAKLPANRSESFVFEAYNAFVQMYRNNSSNNFILQFYLNPLRDLDMMT